MQFTSRRALMACIPIGDGLLAVGLTIGPQLKIGRWLEEGQVDWPYFSAHYYHYFLLGDLV